jgi:hypothetical protein
MRKLFVGLLLFVSFNLFAQRQEVGRVYFELRAYETQWEGTYFNSKGQDVSNDPVFGRPHQKTGRIIFNIRLTDPLVSRANKEMVDIAYNTLMDTCNGISVGKTDSSYDVYIPYRDKMVFLNQCINMDSFPSERKYGVFESHVRNTIQWHWGDTNQKLSYEKIWDYNHYEMTWTNYFDVNGFYFVKIEFILYK